MSENLSDALKLAKKNRNVQSKLLIWESGVSKSQFYRIINGKEAPSLETKERISKSLNIDDEQFDLLHSHSHSNQKNDETQQDAKPAKYYAILAVLTGIVALTAFVIMILRQSNPKPITEDTTPIIENIVEQGDRTLFIEDVTIPDGTSIPVNTQFVKTWRVKNIGNVAWTNRYLKRMTPLSDLLCSSPAMVPIPETLPGEIVDISVTFVTPHLPGSCRTDWKTADDRGNLYFPNMHGLFSIVVVTE